MEFQNYTIMMRPQKKSQTSKSPIWHILDSNRGNQQLCYKARINWHSNESQSATKPTLDSGINVAPGITVAPPSSKFSHHDFNTFLHQSRHFGHFLIFFFFKIF
jgi:hypothetical protein